MHALLGGASVIRIASLGSPIIHYVQNIDVGRSLCGELTLGTGSTRRFLDGDVPVTCITCLGFVKR